MLYLTFTVCSSLLMYAVAAVLALIDFGDLWYIFFRVSYHMNQIGTLFSDVVDLLLIMTLVEVGNGFLFCHTESRNLLQRVLRYAAIASCSILAVVAFVAFVLVNAAVGSYFFYDLFRKALKLYAFLDIFLFIWAGVLMGFSAHIYEEVKRNSALRDVSCPWLLHWQGRPKPV